MTTQDNLAVAAAASVDGGRWLAHLDELMTRIAGRFGRVEPRRRARQLVLGLLSDLPRKNCWTIAEHVGDRSPDGLQHLLAEACWDHDGVRDDLRDYVVAGLGDQNAVLVVDETGDLKKGSHTVGVQRQYTGTAGRVENAQVAVYLAYATDAGHAFIDRELYLPRCWADDPDRREAAGVPEEVEFATKPALATTMVCRALDAGLAADWVTGDEVYGADPSLRGELEARRVGYVLAVGSDRRLATGAGVMRADQVARTLPRGAWQQHSAGAGAKGPRLYDWALVDIDTEQSGHRWLLVRRNHTTGELAYYRCYSPRPRRYRRWSPWPDGGGPSRRAFRPAKGCAASMNTRSGAGPPGTAGPSCPCSPTHSSPSWPHANDQHRPATTIYSRSPATRSSTCSPD